MKLGELIELAATITSLAPELIQSGRELAPEAIAEYWSASKCRQQRWAQAIKRLATKSRVDHAFQPGSVIAVQNQPLPPRFANDGCVLPEIFASEVLARVWTGVAVLHDQRRQVDEAAPIVRGIFIGHLEARHRALKLLVNGSGSDSPQAARLNRLRRRAERWNDLLIGCLLPLGDVSELAFDAELAAEFARDAAERGESDANDASWRTVAISLRAASRGDLSVSGPNADLNQQIAAAIVNALGHDAFELHALPHSLARTRLLNAADRLHALVNRLLAGSP